jgi:hypothetical protein
MVGVMSSYRCLQTDFNYRDQEKEFPRSSPRRLLKKSEIKDFAYKIMGMEFFDRSIL